MDTLTTPLVWSDRHRLHGSGGEVWVGVEVEGNELPERANAIRETLTAAGMPLVEASAHPDELCLALHDPLLVEYLAGAWAAWQRSDLPRDPGQPLVVAYLFPHPGLLASDGTPIVPAATSARAGRFAYDTMTVVGEGTWEAARAALDVAVTAAELVLDGEPIAYACCRPPGHHATRECFGGSCYLNNAAAAAARLRSGLGDPVAVIDIDAHHGNGTQSIFYDDPGVLTASVHVDPAAGWFPHYLGFEHELGAGRAEGANRNACIAPGAGDGRWLEAIAALASWARDAGARGLVVALGTDAAAGDPESPIGASPRAFREAGRILGALGLPTVVVQEGGYVLETIGSLVLETLAGIAEGAAGEPR